MGRYGDDVNAVTRWRTRTQKELHRPLAEAVGAKTAKAFSALHVGTVGEALGHLPRRYLTGTETTDLSHLVIDTEVALVADVVGVEVHTNKTVTGRERRPRQRLEVMLSDVKRACPLRSSANPTSFPTGNAFFRPILTASLSARWGSSVGTRSSSTPTSS